MRIQREEEGLSKVAEVSTAGVVVYAFPLGRTHCGVLLGNGLFGVSVWGSGDCLNITINRSDYWDRRAGELAPGEGLWRRLVELYDPQNPRGMDGPFEVVGAARPKGAFRNTRLPMGRFELRLAVGSELREARLCAGTGELRVVVGVGGIERELVLAVHPQEPVLWVDDPHGVVVGVTGRPAWEWVADALQSRGYVAPERWDEGGLVGWSQGCPEDPAMAGVARLGDSVCLIAMADGADVEAAWSAGVEMVDRIGMAGRDTFFGAVVGWWGEYAAGLPQVSLPDAYFDDFLRQALFKFGAATSPLGGVPAGLQGPWCEEYQMPPWGADYHFNVNIQEIYTLALASGKMAHLLPLFDMLERCLPVFREQARRLFGIDDGIVMSHTTDDRGYACGGVGPGATIDQAVSGWTAQLYWQYFEYTGDLGFLRQRALPFMHGVMRAFEEMVEWVDGVPRLPVGISAEYGQAVAGFNYAQRVGPQPSYQLSCMHMLLRALAESYERVGEEMPSHWVRLRECLAPWELVGAEGQERIAIWQGLDLEVSHRHHSHLACIYPFDSLGQRTEEMEGIVARSLDRWIEVGMSDWSEWCYSWAAIIQAREGYRESPWQLLKLCRELYINEGMATVYQPRFAGISRHGLKRLTGPLETCEVMQLDGTMGIATALLEMLVHQHRGVVRYFGAIPACWREVSFSGIHLPGGHQARGVVAEGEVVEIGIESERGGVVTIDVPGYAALDVEVGGKRVRVELPWTVDLQPGQSLLGRPLCDLEVRA